MRLLAHDSARQETCLQLFPPYNSGEAQTGVVSAQTNCEYGELQSWPWLQGNQGPDYIALRVRECGISYLSQTVGDL